MDRRGFGFIHGYRNIRIFFHISVLKRAHFPNFEQLLELLENEKYSLLDEEAYLENEQLLNELCDAEK